MADGASSPLFMPQGTPEGKTSPFKHSDGSGSGSGNGNGSGSGGDSGSDNGGDSEEQTDGETPESMSVKNGVSLGVVFTGLVFGAMTAF